MGRLIVNADDFGLTPGVNRAIIELNIAGLVTSTSLMARAAATDEAIELARSAASLGVGCHIILADGEPTLQPGQIATLIDQKTGCFHVSLAAFLARLFTGRVDAAEIEAEAEAQIAGLQKRGLSLTHIDTHKHLHIFPSVLRPVLRAARKRGIRAVRNPFEPAWGIRATHGAATARVAQVSVLRWLEPMCRRIIAEEGFSTTDGTIAVAGTGTFNAHFLRSLLQQLPAGTWELVTHPGYNDADLGRVRTRLRAERDIERLALCALKEFPAIDLASFADLVSR